MFAPLPLPRHSVHLNLGLGRSECPLAGPPRFDDIGDTNGADFLAWQREESAWGGSAEDLALWQSQSCARGSARALAIPEPATLVLVLFATVMALGRDRCDPSLER